MQSMLPSPFRSDKHENFLFMDSSSADPAAAGNRASGVQKISALRTHKSFGGELQLRQDLHFQL